MMGLDFRNKMLFFGKYKYILLLICIGILLMLSGQLGNKEEPNTKTEQQTEESAFNLDDFQKDVQKKLSMISGAGRVEVILSLKSGTESVYASDVRQDNQQSDNENSSSSDSSTYQSSLSVVSDSSYGQKPVLIKTVYPEFRGAVVICDGANDSQVRYAITEAIRSLCGVSSDNISIMKMQKEGGA